jgi:hypothetical protein
VLDPDGQRAAPVWLGTVDAGDGAHNADLASGDLLGVESPRHLLRGSAPVHPESHVLAVRRSLSGDQLTACVWQDPPA